MTSVVIYFLRYKKNQEKKEKENKKIQENAHEESLEDCLS
jgi:hypothetical protein